MHIDRQPATQQNGGETTNVSPKCTTLCGEKFVGKSCSKTVLVDIFSSDQPEKIVRAYAIIDDQSNRSLASPRLFDKLNIQSSPVLYTISTCSGKISASGRRASDLCIRSLGDKSTACLSNVIECDDIPTPAVAKAYSHLEHLSHMIPNVDNDCEILLLIGRDCPELHHVHEQITGDIGTPFAQKLKLGWVIVGEICLGRLHSPESVVTNKISIMSDGRATYFDPCRYSLDVEERVAVRVNKLIQTTCTIDYKSDIFHKSPEDEHLGLSQEDKRFLEIMNREMYRDEDGFWTAPLPFKENLDTMPTNRSQALHRGNVLDSSLKKDQAKRDQFVDFMTKILDSRAAEVAPETISRNHWYLPLFAVYHPKKQKLRGVFDSSAVCEGVSLNSLLMSGPDLINNLVGILLRFRRDSIAIAGDFEKMFYRFRVSEKHRDFLRFFWYRNNNPDNDLIEYRMKVHVFGNCASPAVATFGLRRSVEKADISVREFVERDFYVDDGITSKPTVSEAVKLMQTTKQALQDGGNIRLHKIVSNNKDVMKAFSNIDLDDTLRSVDMSHDDLPIQRSLGISWDLLKDVFVFSISLEDKPFTKRGVLSTVNSIFDSLGFIAPITISGKILLREITPHGTDWDSPLPNEYEPKWLKWKERLQNLQDVAIPRMFTSSSVGLASKVAVQIFSDASKRAIAAVSYIRVWDSEGNQSSGFLLGKAKVAPSKGHTIPRLELCGAVLATEVAEIIVEQMDIRPSDITFFTDSKIVLGYIFNKTRRFYTFVSNRVDRILRISKSEQWKYIASEKNPADSATRNIVLKDLKDSLWLKGPPETPVIKETKIDCFSLIDSDKDKEVRPVVSVHSTNVNTSTFNSLGCEMFKRFSCWTVLVRALVFLKCVAQRYSVKHDPNLQGDSVCGDKTLYTLAERLIIQEVQRECFVEEISCLTQSKVVTKSSPIEALCPFIDQDGILRVGGRLNCLKGKFPHCEINPIILPKIHHVSILLIRHHHEKVKHQGRSLTEGVVRSAGFWVVGAKRMISSLIHDCVICRRMRRPTEEQKMADLPEDRLTPGPPFSYVGVDAFGPWEVITRKTRGGTANKKRWAILFTCLSSRAVHVEVVEEMSSSCFINALRRFQSIRGPVKIYRSDRGTNFIGAVNELKIDAIKVEDGPVGRFLDEQSTRWIFNTPHSSHMGGVWERVIGMTRRVLDALLYEARHKLLTHEVLYTFMPEVSAILNNRPLVPISMDPDSPTVLRPSMLLTGKTDFVQVPTDEFNEKDTLRYQWKCVQFLADKFWELWHRDYLQLLQSRRKWSTEKSNIKCDDVVILREPGVHRNYWPLGIITRTFEGEDNMVRKVEVRVIKDDKSVYYVRSISEVVQLIN